MLLVWLALRWALRTPKRTVLQEHADPRREVIVYLWIHSPRHERCPYMFRRERDSRRANSTQAVLLLVVPMVYVQLGHMPDQVLWSPQG